MAVYSPAAIFASEAAGMTMTIFLGNSVIANELLSNTKGRLMGWGFVALGYGMAFGMGILAFGFISAHLNPAMCLALLILGKINGTEFAAAVAGEFLGAFVASFLVWLHFIMHFKTVPEPPSRTPEDMLLRSRDALSPTALGIASYNTKEDDVAARKRGFGDLKNTLSDLRYFLSDAYPSHPDSDEALIKVALGSDHETREHNLDPKAIEHRLRRRSVQVGDVHRRLQDMSMDDFRHLMSLPHPNSAESLRHHNSDSSTSIGDTAKDIRNNSATQNNPIKHSANGIADHPAVTNHRERLEKLYEKSLIADSNAKLSIFCTRPALYSPLFNFITEFLATTTLLFGALMIDTHRELLYGPERMLLQSFDGLIIGFFVFLCVLSLGGPTGIAANPARDFSPRLAHFLLPIPGKGRSEWYYSWIPVIAPFSGGCAAAGLYALFQMLNHSKVPGNETFPSTGSIGA